VALSPDGRRIAYVAGPPRNGDIWVRDLDRATDTRLTFGDEDELQPAWLSPARVAYVQMKTTSGGVVGRILAISADGSGGPQVVVPELPVGVAENALTLAGDGKRILLIVDERGHGYLRVAELQPDGSLGPGRPVLRIEPEPAVGAARVSPDGGLLAYVTENPGGQPETFLTRFPSGEGRWQVSPQVARNPRWARDGSELFFLVGAQRRTLASVKVNAAMEPPLVSNPTNLFDFDLLAGSPSSYLGGGGFDVTGDGQRFLVVRPGGSGGAKRMVLVQNWLSEFRTMAGPAR
jgi:Tol biopolymer transport system component